MSIQKVIFGGFVVEFWAGWNSTNECTWLAKLNECEVYRVDIGKHIDIQTEYIKTNKPTNK